MLRRRAAAGRAEAGFTLVETLVGIAIGLVVVAAATTFVIAQLEGLHALWVQSRLMQELRVAAEIVARELRRAGHWSHAAAAPWQPDHGASVPANPHAPLSPLASQAPDARFSYSHDDPSDAVEPTGFRLHDGAIEMRLGDGRWQALTDAGSLVVTAFTLTPAVRRVPLHSLCAKTCGDAPCGPVQEQRTVSIAIRGRAAADPRMVRSVQSVVRVRNDVVVGACPA